MPCGGGWWVPAQLALMAGRGRGGLVHLKTLITCLGSQGPLIPCSLLMIRVGRPLNLLLLLMGRGPFSLMHSARSNKSSPEGDTPILRVASGSFGSLFGYYLPPCLLVEEGGDTTVCGNSLQEDREKTFFFCRLCKPGTQLRRITMLLYSIVLKKTT
jgi:hypothetical protein